VKLLLDHGAALKKGFRSQTPFHSAVGSEKSDVVRLLQERWPEGTREKDAEGNTSLHLAVDIGQTDVVHMVRFLMQNWPEGLKEKDLCGNTPLHLALATFGKGISM
jgi:ankyrin repeat protein